jgi:hypothetical protein
MLPTSVTYARVDSWRVVTWAWWCLWVRLDRANFAALRPLYRLADRLGWLPPRARYEVMSWKGLLRLPFLPWLDGGASLADRLRRRTLCRAGLHRWDHFGPERGGPGKVCGVNGCRAYRAWWEKR